MSDDAQLLRAYAEEGDEAAVASAVALIERAQRAKRQLGVPPKGTS